MSDDISYQGLHEDKVFQEIVNSISPAVITEKNRSVIDAFVDILSGFSPISINISDVFYKENPSGNPRHENHMLGVQEGFAEMHLENFWSAIKDAKNDYLLRNNLNEVLHEYNVLNGTPIDEDIGFFMDPESLFKMDRFLAGREFKMKKGTAVGLEYAYRAIWNSKIEGFLQSDYSFEISNTECKDYVSNGLCINPLVPVGAGCGEPGKRVGTFRVAELVTPEMDTCTAFTYIVHGSLMTEFFDKVVRRLAHPVGYKVEYRRIFNTDWVDYFNVLVGQRADKVYVYSLCPSGICAIPLEELYAGAEEDNGGGITSSYLTNVLQGVDNSGGEFNGKYWTKYIFNNGYYLMSYSSEEGNNIDVYITYHDNNDVEITRYNPIDHAAVLLENPYKPSPILLTRDEFEISHNWGDDSSSGDLMNDMFNDYTAPMIGFNMYIQDTTLEYNTPEQPWGDEGGFVIGVDRDNVPACCKGIPTNCCSVFDCCLNKAESGVDYVDWDAESDVGVTSSEDGIEITALNGSNINAKLALNLSPNITYDYSVEVVTNGLTETMTLLEHDGLNTDASDLEIAAGYTGIVSGSFTTVSNITNSYWQAYTNIADVTGQTVLLANFTITRPGENAENVIDPDAEDTCCIEGFVIPQGPYNMIYVFDNMVLDINYIDDISNIQEMTVGGFDALDWTLINSSITPALNCLGGSNTSLVPVESGISTATREFDIYLPANSFVLIRLIFNTCFWGTSYDLGAPGLVLKIIDESLTTIAETPITLISYDHEWGVQVNSTDKLSLVIEMPDGYKETINSIIFEYVDGSKWCIN